MNLFSFWQFALYLKKVIKALPLPNIILNIFVDINSSLH